MYEVKSTAVSDRLGSYCRTFRLWLESADSVITGEKIISASSTAQSTSLSDDIELGAVCSQSWDMTISGSDTDYLGGRYELYLYLADYGHGDTTYADLENYTYEELSKLTIQQISRLGSILGGEKIPMGSFTCVRSKKSGDSTSLTFADRLYFSDRIYTPSVRLPAWSKAVEDDICKQLGLENGNDYTKPAKLRAKGGARLYGKGHIRLKTANFDFMIDHIPEKATMRQMLGYIASAQGQFGFVNRFGKYVRKWYGSSVKLLDNNTIDVPVLSERKNVIVGILCKVNSDQTLKQGVTSGTTGRVLEFENPYMTSSLLQSLWHRIGGFSWYTTELFHRLGDPRFDIGDVVTYDSGGDTFDIPITDLSFDFDGGLSADISAAGLSVEEQI